MIYEGISTALKESRARLHASRNSGGARVVRIETQDKRLGYGEGSTIEEALVIADADCLSGGTLWERRPRLMGGTDVPIGPLDELIFHYHILLACWNSDRFLCELIGHPGSRLAAMVPLEHRIKRIGSGLLLTEAIGNMLHADPIEIGN